jgi:release factor glutamine methyltransferase
LKHSDSAAIDAEILLAHALSATREEMLAHDDRPLPARVLARYRALIARRAKHEPIAYLTGHKEFFGLDFFVDKNVLIPRPETEQLVELALSSLATRHLPLVIDIGTGSGAIAVSIAANDPNVTVIATDISAAALKLATRNAVTNDVAARIIFKRGDLLQPFLSFRGRENSRTSIIITANLPYLPAAVYKKTALDIRRYEPRSALVAGKDGLDLYDRLFDQAAAILSGRKLTILCEIDPSQKKKFPALVKRHLPRAKVEIKNDLAGRARVGVITS